MPDELQTKPRAKLVEVIELDGLGTIKNPLGHSVEAQFNPQSLDVNYNVQTSGGDQQSSTGRQFMGTGSTSMSVDFLFDVTRPEQDANDVRELTQKVHRFIENQTLKEGKYVLPLVRFVWGSMIFEGVVDSMDESLEFFDPEGRPLRATVTVSMSRQEMQFKTERGPQLGIGVGASIGTGAASVGGSAGVRGASVEGSVGAETGPEVQPEGAANANATSVQQVAAKQGKQGNWKEIAAESGVENPRAIHNPEALGT